MREIKAPVKTIGMRAVGRPIAFEVDAKRERMLAADQAEVIQEVEALVALMIWEAGLSRDARGIRHEVKESLRQNIVYVGGRVELPQGESVGAPLDGIEVVLHSAAEQVVGGASFLFTRETNAELIDHGRGEGVSPVHHGAIGQILIMALENRKITAVTEYPAAVRSRIGIPGTRMDGDEVLFARVVVKLQ